MVREETGVENLPLNCWCIAFIPFDYINYQGKKLKEILHIKLFIYKGLLLQIHNDFLWTITDKYPQMSSIKYLSTSGSFINHPTTKKFTMGNLLL